MYQEFYDQFDALRKKRWPLVETAADEADELDDMLADIANFAIAIFVARRVLGSKEGFQSNGPNRT